tara:strand:+ start:215 stop:520 length:306 start_codon:yes stop_codon:yes gene_type:complete
MSKDKNYELKDLIIDACESFDKDYGDMRMGYDDDEVIHEIADNYVPIYYYDIGQYAAHNSWLMTEIPEINSEGNAHDQIQANIYQYIVEGLYEHKQEKEDD